jgi:hypothetical protein
MIRRLTLFTLFVEEHISIKTHSVFYLLPYIKARGDAVGSLQSAVGSLQLAVGNLQLAVGSLQLAVEEKGGIL